MLYLLILLIFLMITFITLGVIFTKRIINPLSVFNFIWLVVIVLYQFRLSSLQQPLNKETIITFIICMLSFSFIYILDYIYKLYKIYKINKKDNKKNHKNKENFYNKKIKEKLEKYKNKNKKQNNKIISFNIIRNIFIFWVVIEIIETIYSGGLPIIWKITGDSKTYMNYGIPTLHGFMNSIELVTIMLSFYLYMHKKQKYNIKDKKLIFIILFMLLFSLCLITRQVIITSLIEIAIIYLYFKSKISWKKAIIIILVGIILFGLVGNIRTGYKEFLDVAQMKNPNIDKSLIGFYWVYMYLTMTVSNVNNAVLLDINGYGVTPITFTYIPTVISSILFENNSVPIPEFLVTKAFNVSGFFIEFYVGYGNVGVATISFILGLLGLIILNKVMNNKNEKNILYYAVYIQIILLSFFYNHLLYLPSGFQFVLIYLLFKICTSNKMERKEEVDNDY